MQSNPFAARRGDGVVEILRLTGLKTPTEYLTETTKYDRAFLREAVGAWQESQASAMERGGF